MFAIQNYIEKQVRDNREKTPFFSKSSSFRYQDTVEEEKILQMLLKSFRVTG